MTEKIFKADSTSEKVPLASPKILKREVFEASREARDIVALAQEKAKQLIEEAEREREIIRHKARQEGVEQGLVEWNQVLARTNQRADELARNWEEKMLRLSVRVAEKIIGEQLRVHPDTVVDIVREVLQGARPGRHLTIQVNEADAQQVRLRTDRLRETLSASSEIHIVASSTVPPGGCIVESELGIIDARLETQLRCLEEVLIRSMSAD
jgi:type III secretion protein L